ncbi:hypothetical protein AB4084_21775, partial [Lysobacter sp. 2RAB21]
EHGREVRFYNDPDRLEQHLREVSPIDAPLIKAFCDDLRRFTKLAMHPFLTPPPLETWREKLATLRQVLPAFRLFWRTGAAQMGPYADRFADPLLRHYQRHLPSYRRGLQQAIEAFDGGDAAAICECATHSAQLAQWVTPKAHFEALAQRRRELGADGIVVAHTGSLLGYLFVSRPDAARMSELSSFFRGLGRQCRFAETGL